jgi:hypothetical protein
VSGEPGLAGRRRGWLVVIGVAVGVIAMSGALLAVLNEGDAGGDGSSPTTTRPPERTRWQHEWPASYAGDVWITVDAPDAGARTVTIRWGPWQRQIVHDGDEPATYVFTKNVTLPGEETVPTTVTVEPGATITFGSGEPPAASVDVNDDWTPASDEGAS